MSIRYPTWNFARLFAEGLQALILGMEQHCPKAPPISYYPGIKTCESMIGQRGERRNALDISEPQLERFRVRQSDARSGALDGLRHRRGELPHELPARIVVDQLGRDTETRGGGAVVLNSRLQSAILLIAVDIDNDGDFLERLKHLWRELHQIADVVGAHGVLILRAALAAADALR